MFQLGSLVVIWGLLTGTSASVSELIQELDKPNNSIQILEIWANIIENNNPVPVISSHYYNFNGSLLMNNTRIRLDELLILELEGRLSSNNNSTEMKIPLVVDVMMIKYKNYPKNVFITVLKLQCSLRVERESQNSLPYVTLGKCSNATMKDIPDSSGRLVPNGSI